MGAIQGVVRRERGLSAAQSPGLDSGDGGDWPPKTHADGGASSAPPPSTVDATAPTAVNDPVDPGTPVDDPQNAFTGAGSYEDELPAFSANAQHARRSPASRASRATTAARRRRSSISAGTIWQAPDRTQGAPGVEIRIIDASSMAHSVHSDADGNFWDRSDTDSALPALSGVRDSSFKAVGQLNGVSCNECHNTGNADPGRLFVQ